MTYSLTLRQVKGQKLTIAEMDGNFLYLQSLGASSSQGTGATGATGPGLSGTASQIPYYNSLGNVTSDASFIRNPVTKITLISSDVNPNGSGFLSVSSTQTKLGYSDMGASVSNRFQSNIDGNSIKYDANTNETIIDYIIQTSDVDSTGIFGNAMYHKDTSTNEKSSVIAGNFRGDGGATSQAGIFYESGINNSLASTMFVNADGSYISRDNFDTNQNAALIMDGTVLGLIWDFDKTDSKSYSLLLQQSILPDVPGVAQVGRDELSGEYGINGIVDMASFGSTAGSNAPTMIYFKDINDYSQGYGLFQLGNYETGVRLYSQVQNGNELQLLTQEPGFTQLSSTPDSSGQVVLQYGLKTYASGQVILGSINGATNSITLDCVTPSITILSDNILAKDNIGDVWFGIDTIEHNIQLGDITSENNNKTFFSLNDLNSVIYAQVGDSFFVGNTSSQNFLKVSTSGGYVQLGDVDRVYKRNYITVDVTNGFISLIGSQKVTYETATISSTMSVLPGDYIIGIDTTTSPVELFLSGSDETVVGTIYIIKDIYGNASVNNITINGNGSNIDGSPRLSLNTSYTCATLAYSGEVWSVISKY